jgi:hypothetical protein
MVSVTKAFLSAEAQSIALGSKARREQHGAQGNNAIVYALPSMTPRRIVYFVLTNLEPALLRWLLIAPSARMDVSPIFCD